MRRGDFKGDFSRLTFRELEHFSSVRLQQGRVQVDADWNEQIDIAAHRDEISARDEIGFSGVPAETDGFAVGMIVVPRRMSGVHFQSATTGFAVGDDATILTTPDSGTTWTRQTVPGPVKNLRSINFGSAANGIAVGDDATILTTANTGALWTSRAAPPGVTGHLRGVRFASATAAFAVGDGGIIIATTDAGTTWTRQSPPAGVTADLHGVYFTSPSNGCVVGRGGAILTTTDGGTSWTRRTPPAGVTVDLHGVHFPSASTGFAVGDDGAILTTADGGATWAKQSPPAGVTAHLRAAHFTSASNGFAVGDDAVVLATSDGGMSWTKQNLPAGITADLRDVSFAAALGSIVGDEALILRTPTAGAAWSKQSPPTELGISAGRIYVDGVLCENERPVAVSRQPQLPGGALPTAIGHHLFYLDVWQRHLTAVERPALREVALGGPDTATRTQTVWQVRSEAVSNTTCSDFGTVWADGKAGATGRLAARARPGPPSLDPCEVPPGAGYRRLENQLYRVEIHDPTSSVGGATYKWGRNNGCELASVEANGGTVATIAGLEKDGIAGFAGALFAEFSDEERSLTGSPGVLLPVSVQGQQVTIGGGSNLGSLGSVPTARRWESGPLPLTAEVWLDLEDGIQVRFDAGSYRSGDYWTIPARTRTGEVEWPADEFGPFEQPPEGVKHSFVPLALLDLAGGVWTGVDDCRRLFPPLTALAGLFPAGGDGQEAMPGTGPAVLSQLLRVWTPLGKASVRFTVSANGAVGATQSDAALNTASTTITVLTGTDGLAACAWRLADTAGSYSQTLEAVLLDGFGMPMGIPVIFTANQSIAAQVGYTPGCDDLKNAKTVQAAIDALCKRPTGGCEVVVMPTDRLDLVVKGLIESGRLDICICLAAGDHKTGGVIIDDPKVSLKLSGCGPGTRLTVTEAFRLSTLRAVVVRDLEIRLGMDAPISFAGCGEVILEDCQIYRDQKGAAVLTIADAGRTSIERCVLDAHIGRGDGHPIGLIAQLLKFPDRRLGAFRQMGVDIARKLASDQGARTNLSQQILEAASVIAKLTGNEQRSYASFRDLLAINQVSAADLLSGLVDIFDAAAGASAGPALVLMDGDADTDLVENTIVGTIALYGPSANLTVTDRAPFLRTLQASGRLTLSASVGSLRMRGNRFSRIALSAAMVDLIIKSATSVTPVPVTLSRLFRSALLTDNVITTGDNSLAVRHAAITSNDFDFRAPDAGAVVMDSATLMGNHAPNDIRLFVVARSHAEAANLTLNVVAT